MQLTRYRLSFIFTETVLAPLVGSVPATGMARPEGFDRISYQKHFDGCQADRSQPTTLTPPWPVLGRQGFWDKFLPTKTPLSSLTGAAAWHNVIPLRMMRPLAITPDSATVRMTTEGFVQPWGFTFVVTFDEAQAWSDPSALAHRLFDLRWEPLLGVSGSHTTLDEAGNAGLDALRLTTMGAAVHAGQRRNEPFSIFTVANGSGAPADLDPWSEASGIHRLLHAGSSFSGTSSSDELPPLEDGVVAGFSIRPASHVIYGTKRGRSIWGPAHFATTGKRSLGCQHRNLVLASSQVESHTLFAQATLRHLAEQPLPTAGHESVARRAMEMLKRLYKGPEDAFRSKSLVAQVDAPGWRDDVNALRLTLALQPL